MNRSQKLFAPRVSLSTLLLLVVALAIGLASWQMEKSIEKTSVEVYPLRFLANGLRVKRPDEYVVVGRTPTRISELVYVVHVPDDGPHELCLAIGEIPRKGVVETAQRVSVSAGVHQVELRYEALRGSEVLVLLDDEPVISGEALRSWLGGASAGGLQYRTSTHLPADRPLTLVQKRFGDYNQDVCSGMLLWVEKTQSGDD